CSRVANSEEFFMTESAASGVTERLAKFVVDLKYDDLPAAAVADARNGVLDLLGVALVGSREESASMLRAACELSRQGGDAIVIGDGIRTTAPMASFVNGYAAQLLDYDDTQHQSGTHMSAAVLPAALALSETLHRSGKELLTAYAAGFEVGCRL